MIIKIYEKANRNVSLERGKISLCDHLSVLKVNCKSGVLLISGSEDFIIFAPESGSGASAIID